MIQALNSIGMNKKDKIKYLKSIDAGAVSIEDLQPKRFKIVGNTPDYSKEPSAYFINDKQVDSETYGKVLEACFDRNEPNEITIIINGRELK